MYESGFTGAYRALCAAHIPVDAIFDESATVQTLEKYPVIFLPNTAVLDENEVRMLQEYVKGGGRVSPRRTQVCSTSTGNSFRTLRWEMYWESNTRVR